MNSTVNLPTGAARATTVGPRMTINAEQAATLARLCATYEEMDLAPVLEGESWHLLAWWTDCPEEGALDLGEVLVVPPKAGTATTGEVCHASA